MNTPSENHASQSEKYRSLEQRLRQALPRTPDADTLSRVESRVPLAAVTRPERASRSSRRWTYATVVAGIVAALVFGVVAVTLPGGSPEAFARERALASLAPSESVLHLEWNQAVKHDGNDPTEGGLRVEAWIDIDRGLAHEVWYSVKTGRIRDVYIRSDGLERRSNLQGIVQEGENGQQEVLHEYWQTTEEPAQGDPGSLYWIEELRNALTDGRAQVEGEQVIDGRKCWKVVWRHTFSDGSVSAATALMDKETYRTIRYDIQMDPPAEPMLETITVTRWSVLDRSEIDYSALFDRDILPEPAEFRHEDFYAPPDSSGTRDSQLLPNLEAAVPDPRRR